MKLFSTLLLGITLTLISAYAMAQNTDMRQAQYAKFPQLINISSATLNEAFDNKINAQAAIPFSAEFNFKGTVISNSMRYANMQVLIISGTEFKNAVLQITKTTLEDKSIIFAGRILNNTAADGYEIKSRDGNYFLQKTEMQKIMQPCNL